MKGRQWSVITLVFVGSLATVSGLIYLAIRFTKEQTRTVKTSPYLPSTDLIPPPISWNYETYISTLPQSGVIKENVIPHTLSRFMEENERTTSVTQTYPPVTKQEQNVAQHQNISGLFPITSFELKWGVLTANSPGGALNFKDLRGQQSGPRGAFALSKWDWAEPKPKNGVINRHAGGLDPVDWSSFDSNCKLVILSRGVTFDLHIRYEQVHTIRAAFNNPIVLVLNSSLAVDVINRLLISQSDEGLCFLIHSTC